MSEPESLEQARDRIAELEARLRQALADASDDEDDAASAEMVRHEAAADSAVAEFRAEMDEAAAHQDAEVMRITLEARIEVLEGELESANETIESLRAELAAK